jgi:hypothetical protein
LNAERGVFDSVAVGYREDAEYVDAADGVEMYTQEYADD